MNSVTDNKGFTLIEVMVALTILGFGIMAMFTMQTVAIKGNRGASSITQNTTLGTDSIERIMHYGPAKLKEMDEADLIDIDGAAAQPFTVDGGFPVSFDPARFTVDSTMTLQEPFGGMVTFDVTLTSLVDGKQVTLQYFRAGPGEM